MADKKDEKLNKSNNLPSKNSEDKKETGITVKKEENFSEWYTQLIVKSELADYSAVSGCIILRPLSYEIWEKVRDVVDKRIKAMGVKNTYFPLFIPESLLKKESTHLEGFAPEVAWVTQGGNTKLAERLAVRPTSETIMYDSYSKWIKSWRDLPLKLNQWNNVVRWEFKHPVPFLRGREFLWNEGHTVFATKEEAEKEVFEILRMYEEVLKDYLALPCMPGKKIKAETFAGAEYTLSLELFLPNGRGIQGPDAHHDGQIFAKAYDIKFLDKNGKTEFAWQNTWAITTRMLGVMFAFHGDNKGLIIPPKLAPIQIIIVPILFEDSKENVKKVAEKIKNKLNTFAVELDDREEYTAGWKFNEWELKGVPLRIELGPKDIQKDQVVFVRRDTGEKSFVKISEVNKEAEKLLWEIQQNLFKKAKENMEKNTVEASNFDSLLKALEQKKLVKMHWCQKEECVAKLKEKSEGAKVLNIPFEQPKKLNNCSVCGKKAEVLAFVAKSY